MQSKRERSRERVEASFMRLAVGSVVCERYVSCTQRMRDFSLKRERERDLPWWSARLGKQSIQALAPKSTST